MGITQPFIYFSTSLLHKAFTIQPDNQSQLIAGCLAGNRATQAELYHLFAPKMMIVCMRYSQNVQEAEEILHDGFIRVFKFLGQFSQKGCFEGWIRKIMVNCALQKIRSQMNVKPVIPFNAEAYELADKDDVIGQISGKEMLKLVQALSPAYRIVFNLYHFEGLKHREIAVLLKIEVGTSKSNLAQAKRILQNAVMQNLKTANRISYG